MIRQATLAKQLAGFAHLIVRNDGVLCTRCATVLPVHPGDGTPLPSFVIGLMGLTRTHPAKGRRCERESFGS